MTRTPLSGSKGQSQGRQAALVGCTGLLVGQHGLTVMVTYPYAYLTYIVSSLAGLGGGYRGGRPPTACLQCNR